MAQNRMASKKFRERNRSCRQQVTALEAENTRLKKEVTAVRKERDDLCGDLCVLREQYWLRRKISFKTLALCVTSFMVPIIQSRKTLPLAPMALEF